MPLSLPQLVLAWVLIGATILATIALNRRWRNLGWWFLASLVVLVFVGNLIEAVVS